MSEVKDQVVKIIVDKLGVKESEVTPEATFTGDLGADSLDTVELVMEFEKAFDIHVADALQKQPSCQRSVVIRTFITSDFMTGIPATPGNEIPVEVIYPGSWLCPPRSALHPLHPFLFLGKHGSAWEETRG